MSRENENLICLKRTQKEIVSFRFVKLLKNLLNNRIVLIIDRESITRSNLSEIKLGMRRCDKDKLELICTNSSPKLPIPPPLINYFNAITKSS